MSDGMATAALARVSGLMYGSMVLLGISFLVPLFFLVLGALILAIGGVVMAWTTKPVDEESAPAHRKLQIIYSSVCGLIAVFILGAFIL